MNAEIRIKEMNDEVRAIKAYYDQTSSNLILYTYELDFSGSTTFINKIVIFSTEDNSNAIAYIEGASYDRMPYEGGAKFFLYRKLSDSVKLHTMQKGTVTVS